jgi:hypothetical protein
MSRTARSRSLETATAAVEAEDLMRRGLGNVEPDFERVLEAAGLQHEVVHPRAVEFAPAEEVRDLHRVEAPVPNAPAYGILFLDDRLDRRPVEAAEEPLVTGTMEVETGALVVTAAAAIGVANPVGWDEASELREELSGEGMVAAEALRLGDKAEQPLRIATCEHRHGSQKDTCAGPRTPVRDRATFDFRRPSAIGEPRLLPLN